MSPSKLYSMSAPVRFECFSFRLKRLGKNSDPEYETAPVVYHEIVACGVVGGAPKGRLHMSAVFAVRQSGALVHHVPHPHTQRNVCGVMGRGDILRMRLYAVASNMPIRAWPGWAHDVLQEPGTVLVLAHQPGTEDGPSYRFVFRLPAQHDGLWDIRTQWVKVPRKGEAARKRRR